MNPDWEKKANGVTLERFPRDGGFGYKLSVGTQEMILDLDSLVGLVQILGQPSEDFVARAERLGRGPSQPPTTADRVEEMAADIARVLISNMKIVANLPAEVYSATRIADMAIETARRIIQRSGEDA